VAGTRLALAEGWNGTVWSVQTTPIPAGATTMEWRGVSCTSSTACTVIGDASGTSQLIFAERWNGTQWSVQAISNPVGATNVSLNKVSCASSTSCTAVGSYTASGTTSTLVESWNGTGWSAQTSPNPTGATSSYLLGVSCTAAAACTAVGFYTNSKSEELPLAERWNGTEWVIQTTPNPAESINTSLFAVSCTSSTVCTAVGHQTKNALAEHWNGTEWSIQATPARTESVLYGLSCTASTACTAVGRYNNTEGKTVTLAEGWNGTEWSAQTTPNPTGTTSSYLSGTSCTAAAACTAVGQYSNSAGEEFALAERN
jgi:hypothetical protein